MITINKNMYKYSLVVYGTSFKDYKNIIDIIDNTTIKAIVSIRNKFSDHFDLNITIVKNASIPKKQKLYNLINETLILKTNER